MLSVLKYIFLSLTILSCIVVLFTYSEISQPVPTDMYHFPQQKLKLKKGDQFDFKIFVAGGYRLNIVPLDQSPFFNDQIEASLIADGFFQSKTIIKFEKYEDLASGFFHSDENQRYTLKIEKYPARLKNKIVEISLRESTASASKNLELMRAFRPGFILVFQISGVLFLVFGLGFVVLKVKFG